MNSHDFPRGLVTLDLKLKGIPFKLIWIPPGHFTMGSPENEQGRCNDEGPQHTVTITKGYWLAETPCTQELWRAVMGDNPSKCGGHWWPVESVSWYDCQDFCDRLNKEIPDLVFRLPTEAEWEYACRAGTTSAFNCGLECTEPYGNDPALDRLGWYSQNSGKTTQLVGEKERNAWGLYDMHGNVCEWCEDGLREFGPAAVSDPRGSEEAGARRVVRGGSYWYYARYCRSAYRFASEPENRDRNLGFRLAATALS